MTPEKLAYFKNKLIEMEKSIIQNIKDETENEENPFEIDGDLVDKAEAFTSVAISEGLTASQKLIIDKIRIALHNIKEGAYGKCVVSGNDIEEDRLEAVPYADTCKEFMNMRK